MMELYVKRELRYEGGSMKTTKINGVEGIKGRSIRVVTNDIAILAVRTNIVIASPIIIGVRLLTV